MPGTRWVLADGSPLGSQSLPALVTLQTGRPTVDQVLGLRRGRQPIHWLRVNARPLAVAGDSRLHAVTSFTDITAERRAERALAAQVEFEALVASISTRLIDCPPIWSTTRSRERWERWHVCSMLTLRSSAS